MKRVILLLLCFMLLTQPAFAALAKSVAEVDAWAEVAGNIADGTDFREGATVDISACYDVTLYIDCALSSTTAHTGTEIIVQVSSLTSGDAAWEDLTRYIGPVGTAINVGLAGDEAAAQTVLTVTDPVTSNLDNSGKWLFLENTATPANSEIVYVVSNSGDAGDTITILDGLTNAQTSAASDFYDIDNVITSTVSTTVVAIPASANRVRILYNNNYDADGSSVYTRCRISKLTGI